MENISIHSLSREQKFAYRKFVQGNNLFITGPGGSGKTQLIHTLVNYCNLQNKEVAVCALTGCASVLLQGLKMKAKTIHSWSGIKLARGPIDNIIQNVLKNNKAVKNWKKVKILIIDEISMMSVKILEILELIARRIRRNSLIFGGIQLVFTGDFYQLPPVGDPNDPLTCLFCFQSKKWREIFPNQFNSVVLQSIFRQKDPIYKNILNQIRIGELSEENALILHNRVGIERDVNNIITRLFPIKSKVEMINQYNFEKIQEKEYKQEIIIKKNCKRYLDTGLPIDKEVFEQCQLLTQEDINFEIKQLISIIPTDEFVLMKKGAMVMLTYNLSVEDGLCNGSQGIIIDILENQINEELTGLIIPIVQFTNGIIMRIVPTFWQSNDYPCIIVGQYPLILAWALTIHKIQGASLDYGEVDAGSAIFEYGQTYVGLSRIRTIEGLYLINFNPKRIKAHPQVKEFYKSIRDDIPEYEIEESEIEESENNNTNISLNSIIVKKLP